MRWFDSVAERPPDEEPSAFVPAVEATIRGTERRGPGPFPVPLPADLGPLLPFATESTSDLVVNEGRLWVDEGGGFLPAVGWARLGEDDVRELAMTLIEAGGRHLDHATPCVDVRLDGGVRVHAVLAPVSAGGTAISVRIPSARHRTLEELADAAMLDAQQSDLLRSLVAERRNILITGAAGTGKTTLLSALMALVPSGERLITVEDVAELRIAHPHVVSLEARQANIEGAGAVGLDRLVRETLRMRPDRIIVGECRGAEVRELLMALATGHDGGAATLHARSLQDVPARLEALGEVAGLAPSTLARLAASALDVVVHLERREGRRRIAAIGRLVLDERERLALLPPAP